MLHIGAPDGGDCTIQEHLLPKRSMGSFLSASNPSFEVDDLNNRTFIPSSSTILYLARHDGHCGEFFTNSQNLGDRILPRIADRIFPISVLRTLISKTVLDHYCMALRMTLFVHPRNKSILILVLIQVGHDRIHLRQCFCSAGE